MMYFSFIILFEPNAAKTMEWHPLRALPPSPTSSLYSSSAFFPLFGWLLHLSLSTDGHLCSRCFDVSFISLLQKAPHTLQLGCDSSRILLLPQTPTASWLLCLSLKFLPLKAKSPWPLYFLMCFDLCPPNKPTNGGTVKPDHGRLAHVVFWTWYNST